MIKEEILSYKKRVEDLEIPNTKNEIIELQEVLETMNCMVSTKLEVCYLILSLNEDINNKIEEVKKKLELF